MKNAPFRVHLGAMSTEVKIADLRVENPDNVRTVYTNNANVHATPWDIRLLFSEIIPTPDGGARLERRAEVVMAPAHAKALVQALQTTISQFEQANGEIPWPPKGTNGKNKANPHPQSH